MIMNQCAFCRGASASDAFGDKHGSPQRPKFVGEAWLIFSQSGQTGDLTSAQLRDKPF
jgi:hypothetical protein